MNIYTPQKKRAKITLSTIKEAWLAVKSSCREMVNTVNAAMLKKMRTAMMIRLM